MESLFVSMMAFAQEAESVVEVQRVSYLQWMIQSLGPLYGFLLPLSGLALFLGACVTVVMTRRPSVIAAYLVFVPIPLLIGLLGTVHGCLSSLAVIANSGAAPKASELAQGVSASMFAMLIGIVVTFPSYLVVALGLFLRAIAYRPDVKKGLE